MASPNAAYVTLNEDLARRADEAMSRYGKASRAAVIAEVFSTYFEFWIELEEKRLALLTEQKEKALGKDPAPLSQTQTPKTGARRK